ncbi:MAG: GNAT family N-acetyltransferase [Oscillospiraceae bacterium]|nr:GNAT family N-acetyltransferase [Oscillospiraceae bacterium]
MRYTLSKGIENNADAIKIREKVFVEEQGFHDEFDEIDKTAWHIIVYENERPLATGRLYVDNDTPHIGRVAVLRSERGRQFGKLIIAVLEKKARDMGYTKTELSAQLRVVEFYEKLGYVAEGDIYLNEDYPHIKMVKYTD